jgi:aminoglycoside phosphotransferase (APT) family kinase protein
MSFQGNPTAPVRSGEDLDWQKLDRHLKKVISGLEGKPEISQFSSGKSNLTYRLKYSNDDLVVRRPPFGTKAKSAHSMIREYRIMQALKPVYTCVPDVLYYTDDKSVIGSEFFVMRKVEGQVIKETIPAEWGFSAADTRRFCRQFWEKLIELHQVDYDAAGLEDFGKPQGYIQRQILGWNSRYERVITPDVGEFYDVREWLETNMPPGCGHYAILHGDYRIDNVILGNRDPTKIQAVLDWEICALGEPLMDLGNALAYWMEPDDPPYLKALQMQPSTAEGMMSRSEILALYTECTGRDTSEFLFYLVYGYFRNAVILQQIYYRYYHGQTQDERFRLLGVATRNLAEHCRHLILSA